MGAMKLKHIIFFGGGGDRRTTEGNLTEETENDPLIDDKGANVEPKVELIFITLEFLMKERAAAIPIRA